MTTVATQPATLEELAGRLAEALVELDHDVSRLDLLDAMASVRISLVVDEYDSASQAYLRELAIRAEIGCGQ